MVAVEQIEKDVDPVVRIRDVNYAFGEGENKKQILFNIDIDLMPGEIIIMTGPSGSGKTTLLTIIGALRTLQEGSAQVMNTELSGLDSKALVDIRKKIGFIFQAHNLFDPLTAHQNVRMSMELHDYSQEERDKLATKVLKQVGLEERIFHKPSELSGEQRQRVAVARAIVNRPKLILADEPTAALDKKSGRDVVNLFRQLTREENCTILMVTHDSRILDVADRIVNMIDGRIASDISVQLSIEICDFLMKCPIISDNPPDILTEISQKMQMETHPAGTTIFREGDTGNKFYVIRSGKVDILIGEGEEEKYIRTLESGDFFGEIALLEEKPRTASIVTREDAEFYTLSKQDFLDATTRSESLHQQLLNAFFKRGYQ